MATAASYLVPAGWGWLAGMRSLGAQAAARSWLARSGRPRGRWARSLARPVFGALPFLALAEAGADKWSRMPDRTRPPSLAFRLLSGGLAGSAVARRLHGRGAAARGAAVGAAAALVSTFAHHRLRRVASRTRLGASAGGWIEDGLAVALGAVLLRSGG
jgi:uncharacterized membrane protein